MTKLFSETGRGSVTKKQQKKIGWLIAGIITVFIIIVAIFPHLGKAPQPQELADIAIKNLSEADTYRFSSHSVLSIGGNQRTFAELQGIHSGPRDRYLKGSLVGSEVEIYFVDGVLYRFDGISGKWCSVRLGELDNAVKILAELEPAQNFAFESMGEAEYLGKVKMQGRSCHKVEIKPILSDKWIMQYFTDIVYTLYIAGDMLQACHIKGVSKENADAVLNIDLEFYDYGAELLLSPPQGIDVGK